jgi:uncharacterized protein YbaR (Trm112 family)/SAM-dependent methyltransferase
VPLTDRVAGAAPALRLHPWLAGLLACPIDKEPLASGARAGKLRCPAGHTYPVVDGIPVLLVPEAIATHDAATRSLEQARRSGAAPVAQFAPQAEGIDRYVQQAIAGTNGIMWKRLRGKLRAYPIPALPLPRTSRGGAAFLDLGCNWGRWCVAASRLGYEPVGIDVSLEAVSAAYRVADQLGAEGQYLVADARFLPFREGSFPVVFSYSVLQHFEKSDAAQALGEAARVMSSDGTALIQMANRYGVRGLYHQARRGFRPAEAFEVRYWSPGELRSAFERSIGPARLSADGYFSLNAQECEMDQLPLRYRCVVRASAWLRKVSSRLHPLVYAADSLWVTAVKEG